MALRETLCFFHYPETKTHLISWAERPNPILLHMGDADYEITVNGQALTFPAHAG